VVSIVAATIGEWSYYVLGSLIESALLAAVVFYAWTWPKKIGQTG
jgi:membrane protein DedA with SNARE-associated domain